MSKPNVREMLRYFLPYAKVDGIPATAWLVIPLEECARYIAHYLYGTIWELTTPEKIREVYCRSYSSQFTFEEFLDKTADWTSDEHCTDCNGLYDAFWRYIWNGGDGVTDINADMNYRNVCEEKGLITDRKKLPIGAAVFKHNKNTGKKTHVGFICGFDADGEPLVLEAQSFKEGVRVNHLKDRPVFTYYGIMSTVFDYSEEENEMNYPDTPVVFEETTPMMRGDDVRTLQQTLNALGYKDSQGDILTEDGKCGARTMQALSAFVAAHSSLIATEALEPEPVTRTYRLTVHGEAVLEEV